ERQVGNYDPGVPQHVELAFNEAEQSINARVSEEADSPSGGNMLSHGGGPPSPGYDHHYIVSEPVPVTGGAQYSRSAVMRLLSEPERYNFVVAWYDDEQQFIGYSGDVAISSQLPGGWFELTGTAVSPLDARYARIFLGSQGGTLILYDEVSLSEAASNRNLLPNGSFDKGAVGWTDLNNRSVAVQIIQPQHKLLDASIDSTQAPNLFGDRRRTVSAIVTADTVNTTATFRDYSLTLSARGRTAITIDDPHARGALLALILLGLGLCVTTAVAWAWKSGRQSRRLATERRPTMLPAWQVLAALGGAAAVYFLFNAL